MSPSTSSSRNVGIVSTNQGQVARPSSRSRSPNPSTTSEVDPLANNERYVEVAGVGMVKWGAYRCLIHGLDLENCLESCVAELDTVSDDRTERMRFCGRHGGASCARNAGLIIRHCRSALRTQLSVQLPLNRPLFQMGFPTSLTFLFSIS
ncbi:hypothetical protein H4582DRAFT_1909368 [Lactarius indigo]|nr:hypothetical protein H4582DRAFT_1909368 [Lactarius indigo]